MDQLKFGFINKYSASHGLINKHSAIHRPQTSVSGLVVEYVVAIDVTRVRFPADAFLYFQERRRGGEAVGKGIFIIPGEKT